MLKKIVLGVKTSVFLPVNSFIQSMHAKWGSSSWPYVIHIFVVIDNIGKVACKRHNAYYITLL